jgi:hypothetical protein
MIKIYKNTISDSNRLKALFMMKNMPELCWTQSVCTDSPVDQLREYLPMDIFKIINTMHIYIHPIIENDFGVKLEAPTYKPDGIISVDRRLKGYFLPKHQDIPTGNYSRHIGSESGQSKITVSCVYYWNDDFTGGELEFEHEGFKYTPEAGDLVVFNSDTEHEIKTITSGERYSTQYFFDKEIS